LHGLAILLTALFVVTNATAGDRIQVYLSPTCDCCKKWIQHLNQAGFQVEPFIQIDMDMVKEQLSVPRRFESCHTAIVDNYVIEGHVPAADIVRLIREQPDIRGLFVPGMPIGSPGMEQANQHEPYEVYALDHTGGSYVFADHRQR